MSNTNNVQPSNDNLQLEKMRYNNNSLSYKLGLGGIAFSLFACFIGLNSVKPQSGLTVFIILLNILILLFGFLSSEKVKTYTKNYSFYMYGLGGLCVLRIFIYPLILLKYFPKFQKLIDSATKFTLNDVHGDAKNLYGNKLGATIIGTVETVGTENGQNVYKMVGTGYLWNNGTFRGIFMIVLLACAAACFIASGYINYRKEKKLSSYLTSIGAKR